VSAAHAQSTAAVEQSAHGAYVAAINSDNVDTVVAESTDDIVYRATDVLEFIVKAAVRNWVAHNFLAYRTKWKKTSAGPTLIGDYTFE
jgi:ketosteroid isomerase-like protein